ncbi:glycosyltransferase family 39 protein [Streptomyces sp. NPDC058239]|uniref:glycosyltransferase family 39 protein n=1 Tax=unclassified Streptomyces TaxID=2593676 RepID=UPI0036632335
MAVARRSGPQLVRLLGQVDAVHGLYYLLMHGVGQVFGVSAWSMRLPSALAVAVTAGGTGWLGRRLAGGRAGWWAGLLVSAMPTVSRYGQEARSYALVLAVAVLATCALLKAMDSSSRWWAVYGASVGLLGWLNMMALLLAAAHGVVVVVNGPGRRVMWRFLVSQAAGIAALSPLLAFTFTQRSAVGEAEPVGAGTLPAFLGWLLVPGQEYVPHRMRTLLAAAAITALALTLTRVRKIPGPLVVVAVPWLVLPPVVLFAASVHESHFAYRYLLFCLPPAALLIGAACAHTTRSRQLVVGLALSALFVPAHVNIRRQDSRAWDTTAVIHMVDARAMPHDGFLISGGRCPLLAAAYPQVFDGLDDLGTAVPAARRGSLDNKPVPPAVLAQRLPRPSRVWQITCRHLSTGIRHTSAERTAAQTAQLMQQGQMSLVYRRTVRGMDLSLYER